MKYFWIILILNLSIPAYSQFTDDFTDGNFSNNPTWQGNETDFEIDGTHKLHLNALTAGHSFLSTPSESINNATWEFLVELDFNPSGSNYAMAYLVSDQMDLSGELNGYYVKIGDSEDEISLYKQQGSTHTKIIDGPDDRVNSTSVAVKVKAIRDDIGNWELYSDITGTGSNYISEGIAFDDSNLHSSFFGIHCTYTSTRADKIFFDDFQVFGDPFQDIIPPTLAHLEISSANQISLSFSEPLHENTLQTANFAVDKNIGSPAQVNFDETNHARLILTFSNAFQNARQYKISIQNAEDTVQNNSGALETEFFYFEEVVPSERQVVINEIYPDPTPSLGLPEDEFLELYNTTDVPFDLQNWQVSDGTTISELDSFILMPNDYVILCPTSAATVFLPYGNVMPLAEWPSLNNDQDHLQLIYADTLVIDEIKYTLDFYQNPLKESGGYSMAQINPHRICSDISNWSGSIHLHGGTPGSVNSIFDDTPDTSPPLLANRVQFIYSDSIQVSIDEKITPHLLTLANFFLSPDINISNQYLLHDRDIFLKLSENLMQDTSYQLSVENLQDCAGNVELMQSITFEYDTVPPKLVDHKLKSNRELVLQFDETLELESAESENNYFLNDSIQIKKAQWLDSSRVELYLESQMKPQSSYLLSYTKIKDQFDNTLFDTLHRSFLFYSDIDTLMITGDQNLKINFKKAVLPESINDYSNFVLDDFGQPNYIYQDPDDEKSFHLIFGEVFKENKEHTLYIKNLMDKAFQSLSTPAIHFIHDKRYPKIDKVEAVSANQLYVVFDEKVDSESSRGLYQYVIEDIGQPIAVEIVNDSAVTVQYAQDFTPEKSYQIKISDIKDLFGNIMRSNQYAEFMYDQKFPTVESVKIVYPSQILLTFSETVPGSFAENPQNFELINFSNADSTYRYKYDSAKVLLYFSDLLAENYQLSIQNLTDHKGNQPDSTLVIPISNTQPTLSDAYFTSDTSLVIDFSQLLAESLAEEPTLFILNDVEPNSVTAEKNQVRLSFNNSLKKEDTLHLSLTNIPFLDGKILNQASDVLILDDFIEEIYFESDHELSLVFSSEFKLSDIDLKNKLTIQDTIIPYLALQNPENSRYFRFLFNQPFKTNQSYAVEIDNFKDQEGRMIPCSKHQVLYDVSPPQLLTIHSKIPKQIILTFSEELSDDSDDVSFYKVNDTWQPENVSIDSNKVILSFDSQLIDLKEYVLNISGISDPFRNVAAHISHTFIYNAPYLAGFNDLIISEVMAKPSSESFLPDTEYIEIYNASAKTIFLSGFKLCDSYECVYLDDFSIEADHYLIITNQDFVNSFKTTQVMGISLPNLNDDHDLLTLHNYENEIVFSLEYHQSWYKDFQKEAGGWSLEMIDVNNPCGGLSNWRASDDPYRGTPGMANSVTQENPDQMGPEMSSALLQDSVTLFVTFNELIDYQTLQISQISIEPAIAQTAYQFHPNLKKLTLTSDQAFAANTTYTISIKDVRDCKGNKIKDQNSQLNFVVPEIPDSADIIINEILFNARSGGVEFIEIYNRSENFLSLQNIEILTGNSTAVISEIRILPPHDFAVFTEDSQLLKDDYPLGNSEKFIDIGDLPSLRNEYGSLSIMIDELLIDSVYYDENYHFDLIKDPKGVSLERISFSLPSNNVENWKSASSQSGYATPGIMNSQSRENVSYSEVISIEPKTFAPDAIGNQSYTFINYNMEKSGMVGNIMIYDMHGRIIKRLAENDLLASQGSYRWDGDTEDGKMAPMGYYLVFMEVFNLKGQVEVYKEKVAVGRFF